MSTNTPARARGCDLNAKGMLASILAAAALIVCSVINALGLALVRSWPSAGLVFVFVAGYMAYLAGLAIERRREQRRAGG